MKKVYSTNLFYRYTIVKPDKKVVEVTENTFYQRLYTYRNIEKKRYPDREELKAGDLLFIRYFAYMDIPDYVEVEPFVLPKVEIKPDPPENMGDLSNPIYWHNIRNMLGKKYIL